MKLNDWLIDWSTGWAGLAMLCWCRGWWAGKTVVWLALESDCLFGRFCCSTCWLSVKMVVVVVCWIGRQKILPSCNDTYEKSLFQLAEAALQSWLLFVTRGEFNCALERAVWLEKLSCENDSIVDLPGQLGGALFIAQLSLIRSPDFHSTSFDCSTIPERRIVRLEEIFLTIPPRVS